MRAIIEMFAKNSILVNFMTVFILVIGVFSTVKIQKELRPPVSIDKVTVVTTYSGASPEEVEKLITIPVEEKVASVSGISRVDSLSSTGVSRIVVEIDTDANNKFEIVQEIFRAVDNVSDLPDDANDPIVREIKSQIFPVFGVALFGKMEVMQLRKWAMLLQDELEMVRGVNSASISGISDPTIDVVVEPKKLIEKHVSISEIMSTLKMWNRSAPAGYVKYDGKEFAVRIDENFSDLDNIKNLIIRTNDMGAGVSIREVGTVKYGLKNTRLLNRYNGKTNIQISVSKDAGADTVKTVSRIKEALEKFKLKLPKEVSTKVYRDDSVRIKSKLNSVAQNAVIGLVLVVIILLVMLNWRIALVTALGLPVAFFGSIWALEMLGHSLNSMTIIGIILVVGMLVDDGIVVAENIFFHYEKGKSRLNAAIDGTREIIIPVIGTVTTTILAFLPLAYMSGVIGNFMSVIPVAVITCLVFSLFECIFVLPNHAAEFMGHSKSKLAESLNGVLESLYVPRLNWVIKNRWKFSIVVILLMLSATAYFKSTFKMRMFPTRGITSFSFNIEAPANTRLEESDKVIRNIEKKLSGYIGKYVDAYRTSVGATQGRYRMSYSGSNTSGVKIYLVDEQELDVHPKVVIGKIKKSIAPLIPKEWKHSFEVGRHGPPSGKPIEIEIYHDDFNVLKKVSSRLQAKLKSMKGTSEVQDDLLKGYQEYIVRIDKEKATILGIDPSAIQRVTLSAFEGVAATKVRKLDDEYDVQVLYPKKYREGKESMLNLMVKTKYGSYVPLRKLASLEIVDAIGSIKHVDQKRAIVISARIGRGDITAYEVNKIMESYVRTSLGKDYPEVQFNFGGEEEERKESMQELMQLFLISLLAIYMVLSLVFQSALYPFFVLIIIPFGVIGALLSVKLHGQMMSFPGLISIVGLIGIVVNDAIILVNYIRDRYRHNKNIYISAVEGGVRRLRPIFLTTVTTFVGLIPAAYELMGDDANMKLMALVIAWGLLLATVMTMFFIPSFICCLYDVGAFIKTKGRRPLK